MNDDFDLPSNIRRSAIEPTYDGREVPRALLDIISIVIVAFNIPNQLHRSLQSLSATYQRDVLVHDYEVIVVDNGSFPPVEREAVEEHGTNFRLVRIDEASPSPANALNEGVAASSGNTIGVFIDGARISTPGMIHFARHAVDLYPNAIGAAPGWYLGNDRQGLSDINGYSRDVEERLLASIDWPADGYRLFEIGTLDESSVDPWFHPITEANALFMSRANWQALGGMDDRFVMPGGGLVNLDILERALALPDAQLVLLQSEATFHQLHGGVSTNSDPEQQQKSMLVWRAEREKIRGHGEMVFRSATAFVGKLPEAVLPHIVRAALAPVRGRASSIASSFDRQTLIDQPSLSPDDHVPATLLNLAREQFLLSNFATTSAILRMISRLSPANPATRLLSVSTHREGEQVSFGPAHFVAMATAYGAVGDDTKAAGQFHLALELDPDCTPALVGLANLRMPGPFYYDMIERLYRDFEPRVVLEIGVYDGSSLSKVTRPSVAIGVDPYPQISKALHAETHIFAETSDSFFERDALSPLLAGRPVDIGFIDGLHTYDQALRDFANLEQYCGPGSVLLLHDTVPLNERTQRTPPSTTFHTGDVWKVVKALQAFRPDLDIFTAAVPWTGLTFVCGFPAEPMDPSKWLQQAIDGFSEMSFASLFADYELPVEIMPNNWLTVSEKLRGKKVGAWSGSTVHNSPQTPAEGLKAIRRIFSRVRNNKGQSRPKWFRFLRR